MQLYGRLDPIRDGPPDQPVMVVRAASFREENVTVAPFTGPLSLSNLCNRSLRKTRCHGAEEL